MISSRRRVKRAPKGVLADKPVYMRLMPSERAMLEELSSKLNRSASSVARLIFLEGAEHFTAKFNDIDLQTHSTCVARQ